MLPNNLAFSKVIEPRNNDVALFVNCSLTDEQKHLVSDKLITNQNILFLFLMILIFFLY